jgi:hypothetical protein
MVRALPLLVALAALAAGCARTPGHTAEVEHPDAGGWRPHVWHFLVAVDGYDRALWVQDGEELREEMEQNFHGRPQAVRVRIVGVEKGDARATVTASVTYSDGSEAHVPVVVTKGEPAWLVDWPATRALWE